MALDDEVQQIDDELKKVLLQTIDENEYYDIEVGDEVDDIVELTDDEIEVDVMLQIADDDEVDEIDDECDDDEWSKFVISLEVVVELTVLLDEQ